MQSVTTGGIEIDVAFANLLQEPPPPTHYY